ncbi:MAG: fumarylacetoacetate hydrolase family protein [Candidatus Omnitrophota bacterium]
MRIVRFYYKKRVYWGKLEKSLIRILKGNPYKTIEVTRNMVFLSDVTLLAPAQPTKIILVGLNYRDHAKELKMELPKEPVIFLKPSSAVIGHRENIMYPRGVTRLDYEAELAVVIRRKARNLSPDIVRDYILGYTCLNDVTARDLQKQDTQWTRSKSFDSFCPIGPWVNTNVNPENLTVKCFLNGRLKQYSSTSRLIFPVDYLISFISGIMTIYPGDVISTGTPPGVGEMKCGDRVEIEIEKIGRLENQVVSCYNGLKIPK